MKKRSKLLIIVILFLFIASGSENGLFAWNDYSESDFKKDRYEANITFYENSYSTGAYALNEYQGLSGPNNETSKLSGLRSFSIVSGEDDFALDGGSLENDNNFNDNMVVFELPLGDGIVVMLLFSMLYSLYIRFRIQIKNNNVKKQL